MKTLSLILDQKNIGAIKSNARKFCRDNSDLIRKINSSSKLIYSLIELGCLDLDNEESFFKDNYLWIEVWFNLEESQQISKMLLLNAGHKSVNIKHQLELLFLSTLIKLDKISPKGVEFSREKDISAIQYSKSRSTGHYHFSHLISSLIALSAGKIVNTNSDFIGQIQDGKLDEIDITEDFNIELLKSFINFLYALDSELSKQYKEIGEKWIGREVVLVGIFGAIGNASKQLEISEKKYLDKLKEEVKNIVKNLNLREFEKSRNNLELNKINIGNTNKKAVYQAVNDILLKKDLSSALIVYIKILDFLKDFLFDEHHEIDLELTEIDNSDILINWFGYIDSTDRNSYIGIMNFGFFLEENISFETIQEAGITKEILIGFVTSIHNNKSTFNSRKKYIIRRKDINLSHETLLSIVKLISLTRGLTVHTPLESKIRNSANVNIKPNLQGIFHYQQFNETFIILSEMLYHKDVLTKFISLYHIIENYVYRSPIIELDKITNGNMFSIRNFKNLYEKTKGNESDSIYTFIKKIWKRKINGREFFKIVKDNFKDLKRETFFDTDDHEIFISNFSWFERLEDITDSDNASRKYSTIFYQIRNSIIHNKETEFHISHFNLNNSSGGFIDKVLIEPLRDMVFELIYDTQSDIWYKNDKLMLYKK